MSFLSLIFFSTALRVNFKFFDTSCCRTKLTIYGSRALQRPVSAWTSTVILTEQQGFSKCTKSCPTIILYPAFETEQDCQLIIRLIFLSNLFITCHYLVSFKVHTLLLFLSIALNCSVSSAFIKGK